MYKGGKTSAVCLHFKISVVGILLAIQGRKDYLMLQMVEGTMTFTVDNGRGPIMAVFKPDSKFKFCDGNWHEIHGKHYNLKNIFTHVAFVGLWAKKNRETTQKVFKNI